MGNSLKLHLPPSTKDATHEIKPDKNELNGNVPTRRQQAN